MLSEPTLSSGLRLRVVAYGINARKVVAWTVTNMIMTNGGVWFSSGGHCCNTNPTSVELALKNITYINRWILPPKELVIFFVGFSHLIH